MNEIKDMVEKPSVKDAPSDLIIIGKYILTSDIFNYLEALGQGSATNEIRLINGLKLMLAARPVYGCEFEGKRYDCGSKLEFLKAQVEFGLKHKEIKKEFRKYIRELFEEN